MSDTTPQAGWYPDPGGSGNMRWWDGGQWTDRTQGAGPPGQPGQPWGAPPPIPGGQGGTWGYRPGGRNPGGRNPGGRRRGYRPGMGPGGGTLWQRNQLSFTTGIVLVIYLAIALAVRRFTLIGIFPLITSIRAMSRKEPLAPLALVLAIAGIVFALTRYL